MMKKITGRRALFYYSPVLLQFHNIGTVILKNCIQNLRNNAFPSC